MVVIRLARGGSKKSPFYHVVAADKRRSRDGRFIERLGYFNPVARGQAIRLQMDKERVEYWLAKGAQPSERVQTLIKEEEHGTRKPKKAKPVKVEAKVEEAKAEETKAEEPAKAEEKAKAAPAKEVKAEEVKKEAPAKAEAKAEKAPAEKPAEEAKPEADKE